MSKIETLQATATELFESYRANGDWVGYFREVFGVGGLVPSLTKEEREEFYRSETYQTLQRQMAEIRRMNADEDVSSKEPTRVITVRLPASLHAALRAEAHDRHTSMNKLCITKLLALADAAMVPTDSKLPAEAAS